MDETPRTSTSQPSTRDAGKWIGLVLIAVIVGEGIWGLIVSLTHNLVLPFLARIMGADANSPLSLGKADFNIPALFVSVLELCFAGIVAVILNSWVQRKTRPARGRSVRLTPIPTDPRVTVPSIPAVVPAPSAGSVPSVPAQVPEAPTPAPAQFWSPPEPPLQLKTAAPPKAPAKPAKPKPPKEVYYNIVGEPINPTEDE